jgi:hypothetical protein
VKVLDETICVTVRDPQIIAVLPRSLHEALALMWCAACGYPLARMGPAEQQRVLDHFSDLLNERTT